MKLTTNYLSGDQKLSHVDKIIYTLFFFKEMLFEKTCKINYKEEINIKEFIDFLSYQSVTKLLKHKTPGRVACDYFTLKFLNNNFNRNKKINILEIGCGEGHYSQYFKKYFRSVNYLGIDVAKNTKWKYFSQKNFVFCEYELGENNDKLRNIISNKPDFIFSTSVLQHIKNDVSALLELEKISHKKTKNLHFVPAPISFINYLKMGFRRYNINDFLRLQKIIKKNIEINYLGNHYTLKTYFDFYNLSLSKKHPIFDFLKTNNFYKLKNKNLLNEIIFSKKYQYPVFYQLDF